jgi:maltoporin
LAAAVWAFPGRSWADEPAPDDTATETATEPTTSRATSAPSEDVEALRARIDKLEQELDAVRERQENTEAGQASETKEPPPPVTTTPESAPDEDEDDEDDEDEDKQAGEPEAVPDPTATSDNRPPNYADGFHFGSYGRVMVGGDHKGRPGRNGDIVTYGSRLDTQTYAELELRREDYWKETGAYTRIVATVAFQHPIFHYNADFAGQFGVRNLYIEETGLGLKKLRVWAGSRMYRGDDIYLLNFWPLDNLNTVGGGIAYTFLKNLDVKLHTGINQPDNPFFFSTAQRPAPLGQLGDRTVAINDRQKVISSANISNIFSIGNKGAGIKPKLYGEFHYTSEAQQEIADRQFEDLPADYGFLAGAQLGMFTGKRSTHLNLIFRYASGLAAYGEFNAPSQLSPDRTSKGAREILTALSGNYEKKWFGLLLGAYFRSFRNASPDLDYWDLNEGIVIARPTVWFGKIAGLSVEGSYQAQQRGVLLSNNDGSSKPQFGQMGRIGVVPFLTPGGRGNYQRPHIQLIYLMSLRDQGARRLYPTDDVFGLRTVDHYFGIGAEWWFGSTSYFRD